MHSFSLPFDSASDVQTIVVLVLVVTKIRDASPPENDGRPLSLLCEIVIEMELDVTIVDVVEETCSLLLPPRDSPDDTWCEFVSVGRP